MSPADIDRLLLLGLSPDEIWCAIAEAGPWTESCDSTAQHKQRIEPMTNLRPLFFAMIGSGYLLIHHPIEWLGAVFLLALVLAVLWLGLRLTGWFSGHVLWPRPKSRHHDPPGHTSTTSPCKPLPHEVGSCRAALKPE